MDKYLYKTDQSELKETSKKNTPQGANILGLMTVSQLILF